MSRLGEVMALSRSCRVHEDPKKKETPLMCARSQTSSSWNVGPEGRSEGKASILKNRRPDSDQVTQMRIDDLQEGRHANRR
jgi:hypothetical protein